MLTDSGSGYKSKKFADASDTLNLKHIFTQPCSSQTKGSVEHFIQTLLREWLTSELMNLLNKEIYP